MHTFHITVKKAQKTWVVDYDALPAASKAHILEYGVRQILNDAAASAKTEDEARGMVDKRFNNLVAGILRAAPSQREGDPVRARAMQLVFGALKGSEKIKAHFAQHGYKPTDKEAIAFVRETAEKVLAGPAGKKFLDQAEMDVAAQKALSDIDIDL